MDLNTMDLDPAELVPLDLDPVDLDPTDDGTSNSTAPEQAPSPAASTTEHQKNTNSAHDPAPMGIGRKAIIHS